MPLSKFKRARCSKQQRSQKNKKRKTAPAKGKEVSTELPMLQASSMLLQAGDETKKDAVTMAPTGTFPDDQNASISAVAILDAATAQIVEQPTFAHLDGVDGLQPHQEASKKTAKEWRDTIRTTIFSVNDAIINYNSEFSAMYDPLYDFAGQLPNKDVQANLVEGLQALREVMKAQKKRVDEAGEKLKKFYEEMSTHKSDLSGDLAAINAKYEGDKGELADLQNTITALETAMRKDLTIIGLGSGGVIVGGLTVAVGVVMWLETAGASTYVIGAGLVVAAGSATAVGIAGADYSKKSKEKAQKIQELASKNAEITVAHALQGSVGSLVEHIADAIAATDKISTAWGQLDRDYASIIEALERTEDKVPKGFGWLVQSGLRAAKKSWDTLEADAQKIKANILGPMKVDDSWVKNAKKGSENMPEFRVDPPKAKLMARAPAPTMLKASDQPSGVPAVPVDSSLRLWVENTTKSLLQFEATISTTLKNTSSAPTTVVKANASVKTAAAPADDTTNQFISSNESLGKMRSQLISASKASDAAIVNAAFPLFEEVAKKVEISTTEGEAAQKAVSNLEHAIMNLEGALDGWETKLENDEAHEKSLLDDAKKARDAAQKDKDDAKKDYWWCFLGPVACAVVAAEASAKVSSANKRIDDTNKEIAKVSKSLSDLLQTTTEVNSLGAQASGLKKSIDGGLTALQVILSTVQGITANYGSITPFVVRAHLMALASTLEGISDVSVVETGKLMSMAVMFIATNDTAEDAPIGMLADLQSLAASSLSVQGTAKLSATQPKLLHVNTTLKQDQELLRGHALSWILNGSNTILSCLSYIKAAGDYFKFLSTELDKLIKDKKIAEASVGIDDVIDHLAALKKQVAQNKVSIGMLGNSFRDDVSRFNTVADVLRSEIEGDGGELALLEAKEQGYAQLVSQNLEDIVNASTNLILETLAWEVVAGVSIALGQVEFAASGAGGRVVMDLVKKGANVSLKSASQSGKKYATGKITSLVTASEENIGPIIEERGANLTELAKLNSDVTVLHVLIRSVKDLDANTDSVMHALTSIADHLDEQQSNFNIAKLYLQSSDPSKGAKALEASFKEWADVSTAADLLAKSFMASFQD